MSVLKTIHVHESSQCEMYIISISEFSRSRKRPDCNCRLTNCNLASFGEFCEHLGHVCPSFTSSTGEPFFLEKLWLESVSSKNPTMHTG